MEWNYRICNSGDKVPILLYELSKHLVTINFCSKLLRLQIVVIKKTRPTDVGILLYFFKQYLKTTTYALDFLVTMLRCPILHGLVHSPSQPTAFLLRPNALREGKPPLKHYILNTDIY